MKKFILAFIVLSGVVFSSYAQYHDASPKIGAGFGLGVAIGPVSEYYPTARALSLKFAVPVKSTVISLTLTTGYTQYVSKNGYIADGSNSGASRSRANFVPLTIGVKDYVYERLFFEGNAGASFNVNSGNGPYTTSKGAGLFATNLGYSIPLGTRGNYDVDISVGYENRVEYGGGYSQIGFKAVFSFGL